MDEVDGLLRAAGERWRASLPPAPPFDDAELVRRARVRRGAWRFAAIGAAAAIVVTVVALNLPPGRGLGAGGSPASPSPGSPGDPASALPDGASGVPAGCVVTRPVTGFVPPTGYLQTPPPAYGAEWYGAPALWTMIDKDGEIWTGLPLAADGRTQKTFWWSAAWSPAAEPEPAIVVGGTRLDGAGTFTAGPGTNASADFGTAMLVGVGIPTPGCWRISARYRDAVLSYVAWVAGE